MLRTLSLSVVLFASSADAGLVATFDVGVGSQASNLQFDFTNGNSYLYIVRWDGATTGRDLFDIVAAAQPVFFAFETQTFPFGEALFAVTIGADFDAGFGTPPDFLDYWHYWVRDDARADWGYAQSGFAERLVTEGSWDGWVFGSEGPPSPIPAPAAIALLVIALAPRRRSR